MTPAETTTNAVEMLRRLVAFDTTSWRSNVELVQWVVDHLHEYGARVRMTYAGTRSAKANVLAAFGPEAPGGVLLSAHTDVVSVEGQRWSHDPFTLTERDGRLFGRGAADMKGFIAACLAVAPRWRHAPLTRPVYLALTHDEETGCLGVPHLVEDLVANVPLPAVAIVGEPTGMRAADRHPGYLVFRSEFQGRAAHSSDPELGVNAITAAARFVTRIEDVRRHPEREPATYNVGRINGGRTVNTVPDSCEVVWETRPAPTADLPSLRSLPQWIADAVARPGLTIRTREIVTVPPLRPDDAGPAVRLARRLGADPIPGGVPYGSEAGFFQEAGIPTVICGPGDIGQAHQPDEWIAVEQLDLATRFLARLTEWATEPTRRPAEQP